MLKNKNVNRINRRFFSTDLVVHGLLILMALTMLLPFVHELAKSFSYPTAVEAGHVNLVPVDFTFGNYYYFARKQLQQLGQAFMNTVIITVGGVVLGVISTALMAFPLSRSKREFRFGSAILVMIIFCFVFQRPLIPYFLAIKSYGLMDSYGSQIIPHAIIPFYLFLMITFFRGLPEDLFDACRIDGGNEFHLFIHIVLPLSKAVLATVAIFLGVQLYNLFFHPLIFLRSASKLPLQPIVRSIMQGAGDIMQGSLLDHDPFRETESIKSALIILTIIPVAVAFPFLQKHFTKGVMVGSVKS